MEILKVGINVDMYSDRYYGDDTYDKDDNFDSFENSDISREEERWMFERVPKHGVHAHAYKKGLDNLRMWELRKRGYTYREIGKLMGCSPSTVRNRLKILEVE